jgi:hypothetical protein
VRQGSIVAVALSVEDASLFFGPRGYACLAAFSTVAQSILPPESVVGAAM